MLKSEWIQSTLSNLDLIRSGECIDFLMVNMLNIFQHIPGNSQGHGGLLEHFSPQEQGCRSYVPHVLSSHIRVIFLQEPSWPLRLVQDVDGCLEEENGLSDSWW